MSRTVYIYNLSHPVTGEIKYVGRAFNLKKRLETHIERAKTHKANRYICDWIKSLLKNKLKPVITEIEKTDIEHWAVWEKYWILYYKGIGCNLCNLSNGGESNDGYITTEETKRLQSEAHKKRHSLRPATKETKEAIAKSLSRPVLCETDNTIFPSMKAVICQTGKPKSTVGRKIANGELINGKKYTWYNDQPKTNK